MVISLLSEESLKMACTIQQSDYGSYYLVLAQRMNGVLLSNDKKLLGKGSLYLDTQSTYT